MFRYSATFLRTFASYSSKPMSRELWSRLCYLGISLQKPTRRGCRAGRRLQERLHLFDSPGRDETLQTSPLRSGNLDNSLRSENLHTSINLHLNFSPTQTLNHATNQSSVEGITTNSLCFVPKLMVSNVMSLAPKITEVEEFLLRNQIDIAFVTETWLKSTILDSVISVPGYSIIRRDRTVDNHGGVCLYISEHLKYKVLDTLSCCDDHEVLWVYLRPSRLPRGFSSIIIAVVYHPHWTQAENTLMCNHLLQSLSLAESNFPNCAFIVAGDFNRLDVNPLKRHFRLKQIVKKPTRKDAILDLILTNLSTSYDAPQSYPAFGLSDHNTITVQPKSRESTKSTKIHYKRDKRDCRKAELGRYLYKIDWTSLFAGVEDCEQLLDIFSRLVHTGLDIIMPLKKVRLSTRDAPWMTRHLKSLIMKRQRAFHEHGPNSSSFKFYRNRVNRVRKSSKACFYKLKVEGLKDENPKRWWKEVKRLGGVSKQSSDITHAIHDDSVKDLSPADLAQAINHAFLEPQQEYRLSEPIQLLPTDNSTELPDTSERRIHQLLSKLNTSKASGPDDIPNWLLKEYRDIISLPISRILTASFDQQRLPSAWKFANITPLPKAKQVLDIKKQLRPISLTPCLSKIAEECVVTDFIKPAILKVIDTNQYGAVPSSSTTMALLHMIHIWAEGTDGNGAAARVLLFDYRKAFDLIDHRVLVNKLCMIDIPNNIINWIIDFLSDRFQRVKLSDECFSEWDSIPSGVPQGTKLGPWLFLVLINDLGVSTVNTHLWKYVDDTTTSEIVKKGEDSKSQLVADQVIQWSLENKVQLNNDKCKELRISFNKNKPEFNSIIIHNKELEVVDHAKLLGLTISSNLTWNHHVQEIIKKASKRLYFLVQLKRANLSTKDLTLFYCSCIRSVITYAVPVFHHSMTNYLKQDLERIQKRALSIICPGSEYHNALEIVNIPTLEEFCDDLCMKEFDAIVNEENHKLQNLLPQRYNPKYNLRKNRQFCTKVCKTNRFKNTFFPYFTSKV